MPASGGRNYAKYDRTVNVAAERERFSDLDQFERIRERANARFAGMRSANREWLNRIRNGIPSDEGIPF